MFTKDKMIEISLQYSFLRLTCKPVYMCLHVEQVLRSKDYVCSGIKNGSVVCQYTPVSPSVLGMEVIYMPLGGGILFLVSRCGLAVRH